MFVGGLGHPAKLFFKGRNGKEFGSEDRVVVHQHMMASVINETMDEMAGEMVKNVLLGAQKRQRVVEKKKRFSSVKIQLMEMNGRGCEHRSDIDVEPFLLPWKKVTGVERIEEAVQTGIAADLLFGHTMSTAWLLFEPHERDSQVPPG